jgi:hypothetical protein
MDFFLHYLKDFYEIQFKFLLIFMLILGGVLWIGMYYVLYVDKKK